MTLDQQLAILQAAKDGKRVQIYDDGDDYENSNEAWQDISSNHCFDFACTYRITEPKKLKPWSDGCDLPFTNGSLWIRLGGDTTLVTGFHYADSQNLTIITRQGEYLATELLENGWKYAKSTKGTPDTWTWHPCGVEQ